MVTEIAAEVEGVVVESIVVGCVVVEGIVVERVVVEGEGIVVGRVVVECIVAEGVVAAECVVVQGMFVVEERIEGLMLGAAKDGPGPVLLVTKTAVEVERVEVEGAVVEDMFAVVERIEGAVLGLSSATDRAGLGASLGAGEGRTRGLWERSSCEPAEPEALRKE